MKMTIIVITSFGLASLPLIIAAFFRIFTLPRKVQAITAEVQRLEGTGDGNASAEPDPARRSRRVGAPDIPGLAKKYFSSSTLAIPSALLTAFYVAGFLLCDSYLKIRFVEEANAWFFPKEFVVASVPLL